MFLRVVANKRWVGLKWPSHFPGSLLPPLLQVQRFPDEILTSNSVGCHCDIIRDILNRLNCVKTVTTMLISKAIYSPEKYNKEEYGGSGISYQPEPVLEHPTSSLASRHLASKGCIGVLKKGLIPNGLLELDPTLQCILQLSCHIQLEKMPLRASFPCQFPSMKLLAQPKPPVN